MKYVVFKGSMWYIKVDLWYIKVDLWYIKVVKCGCWLSVWIAQYVEDRQFSQQVSLSNPVLDTFLFSTENATSEYHIQNYILLSDKNKYFYFYLIINYQ